MDGLPGGNPGDDGQLYYEEVRKKFLRNHEQATRINGMSGSKVYDLVGLVTEAILK